MVAPSRTDLPETPIHPALVRPVLVAGIERELMVPLVGLVLVLLFAFRVNAVTPALAAAVVLVGFPRLRRVNRRDPQAFAAWKRHLRVAGFYAALPPHGERRPAGPPTL